MIKTKIEWTDSSWNPITGCYHPCPYCYARGTANRFKGCEAAKDGSTDQKTVYLTERQHCVDSRGNRRAAAYPYGFVPTFHEYRLNDLQTKGLGKTIFVCSMADMFGEWVPDEWIVKVFDACKAAPGHRYLFLTKNPKRYIDLNDKGLLPKGDEFWYGSTVTDPEMLFFWSNDHNTFLSIEPILAPFLEGEGIVDKVKWVIFGAETGNRKDKVVPQRDWIEYAVEVCQKNCIPIFMKDSMIPIWGEDIITQFPWDLSE